MAQIFDVATPDIPGAEPEGDADRAPATSLRRALRILGDPWTMLILKEAYNGQRRFSGFQRALNIPRQTLSLRLTNLCNDQMMYKRPPNAQRQSLIYALTPKALDLREAMYAIWLWHRANPGPVDALPFDLVHDSCGAVLGARYRCTACRGLATPQSVTIQRASPAQFDDEPRARISRRNDSALTAFDETKRNVLTAASIVGDVPCNEILYLLYQAPCHVAELGRILNLSAPVLRGRIQKLLDLGLIAQTQDGRKSLYSVLPRADGFYPLLMAIAAWGDRWCNGDLPPPETRVHECGALLDGRYICEACGKAVRSVTLQSALGAQM